MGTLSGKMLGRSILHLPRVIDAMICIEHRIIHNKVSYVGSNLRTVFAERFPRGTKHTIRPISMR